MENSLFQKVQQIFQKELANPDLELSKSMSTDDVQGWDSVSHIMVIGAIEKAFGIQFDLSELPNMNTVGDILTAISQKAPA